MVRAWCTAWLVVAVGCGKTRGDTAPAGGAGAPATLVTGGGSDDAGASTSPTAGGVLISDGLQESTSSADTSAGASVCQSGGGSLPGQGSCTGIDCLLTPRPVDVYLIVDRSLAAGDACALDPDQASPPESSTWCRVSQALAGYFMSQPASAHSVALGFMTADDFTCDGGPDNGHAYPAVEMSQLPVTATSPLVQALEEAAPGAGGASGAAAPQRAIESALRGIATFTLNNASSERRMLGVLITAGGPGACSQDAGELGAIVLQHRELAGIETFVVAVTNSEAPMLEAIATAGGAPEHGPDFCAPGEATCHRFVVSEQDASELPKALSAIVGATDSCSYPLPVPVPGQPIDFSLVNVVLDDPDGPARAFFSVAGAEECQDVAGWYLDSARAPQSIVLCPAACELAPGGQLHLSYGCASVLPF